MTRNAAHLNNPGPVDDIRQDNAHRVGAPNHHQNTGSGENAMVGNNSPSSRLDMNLMAVGGVLRAVEEAAGCGAEISVDQVYAIDISSSLHVPGVRIQLTVSPDEEIVSVVRWGLALGASTVTITRYCVDTDYVRVSVQVPSLSEAPAEVWDSVTYTRVQRLLEMFGKTANPSADLDASAVLSVLIEEGRK